ILEKYLPAGIWHKQTASEKELFFCYYQVFINIQPVSRKNLFTNGNDIIENLIYKRRFTMELRECKAIITGGASGLGEATVRKIAGSGGKVLIADLAEDRAVHLLRELGDNVLFLKTDVTKE